MARLPLNPSPTHTRHRVSPQRHGAYLLRTLTALQELQKGRCRKQEFADLCDAINLVEAMVDLKRLHAPTCGPLIARALDAMLVASEEIQRSGTARMSDDDFEVMRRICAKFDKALCRQSAATVAQAERLVVCRIVAQKRNPTNGVRVVAL